jgi:hypothetical protein
MKIVCRGDIKIQENEEIVYALPYGEPKKYFPCSYS